jgi:LmbE family N-acetylglucosaminyl deacetylase
MSATPDNAHREALTAAPEAEVVGKLVALLRAIRPQVVITHGPYGGYGHPDHIRVYESVTAAFALAHDPLADAAHQDEGLMPWSSRLYYTTFDARPARLFIALLRLLRRDPARYGEHGDINLLEAARQITPVTCTIDVEPWQAIKERAFRCYRSQLGFFAYLLRLPRPVRKVFLAREFYTRAIPPVAPGEAHERDFFPVGMLLTNLLWQVGLR